MADDDGNGFRLWQRYFQDFEGGDLLTDLGGRQAFMSYPKMREDDLAEPLDEWAEPARKFANDMGVDSQMTLLYGILPQSWAERVMDKDDITNPTLAFQYSQRQLRYRRAENAHTKSKKTQNAVRSHCDWRCHITTQQNCGQCTTKTTVCLRIYWTSLATSRMIVNVSMRII